jgi:ribulose-5-phosphate 4-epimerase/fuculose-1-phosphate aldolase
MVSSAVSTEAELRRELAACYRIFHALGWVELIYNHITLRLPGDGERYLINQFGLRYDEVTASNLVDVDLQGRGRDGAPAPINPAGLVIHSTIHRAIPEARCVMHTHTTAGMSVACKRGGLAMTNFYAAMLAGQVAYHPFEGVTVNPDEGERMLANMGGKRQLILENHGLLTWGETVPEAFVRMWTLNRACEIQVACAAMGGEDLTIPQAICEQASREALQFSAAHGGGRDVFEAMARLVDITAPDYRN